MTYDLLSFILWMVAYSAIVQEDDDKKDWGIIPENRITYAFKSAIGDLAIPVHFGQLIYTLQNPAPVISIVSASYNIVFDGVSGSKPKRQDLRRVTPFLATYESIESLNQ